MIDDTPENLTVLRKCLKAHNYRVAVARNGKVALERVKRIRPDLILKVQQELRTRNAELQAALERERRIPEVLHVNLSVAFPHELHTLLTGILDYCQILLKELPEMRLRRQFFTQ